MDPSPSQAFLGPALTCALDPMRPDQSYSWLKAYITGIELRPSWQNRAWLSPLPPGQEGQK